MNRYTFNTNIAKTIALVIAIIFGQPLFGQVEESLRRHFIISIDKYPDYKYRQYLYSQNQSVIDSTVKILSEDYKITDKDFVSIVFYGIGTEAENCRNFITLPHYGGQPMQWLPGDRYKKVWQQFNNSSSTYFPIESNPFSLQTASKEYSFFMATLGSKTRCNQTYLLRITDDRANVGDRLRPQDDFEAFRQNGGRIRIDDWMDIIDKVHNNYSFDRTSLERSTYIIDNAYGIYACQVRQNEKPSIKDVISIENLRIKQTKAGHLVSFDYKGNGNYSIERIRVANQNDKGQWLSPYDSIGVQSSHIEFCIPEEWKMDSVKMRLKVWAANSTDFGAMVISPYDSLMGEQLTEEKHLELDRATIFGFPLNSNWLWFTDDAQLTSMIWTIIFVVLAVILLFVSYFILRKYKATSQNTSISVKSQSTIRVDLMDKNKRRVVVANLQIDVKKPSWSKGRTIKENVEAEIVVNEKETTNFVFKGDVLHLSSEKFSIRDYTTNIDILVSPDAFCDYKVPQTQENTQQKYSLPVTIFLKSDSGAQLASKEITFDVIFKEIKHDPELRLEPNKHLDSQYAEVLQEKGLLVFLIHYTSAGGEIILATSQFNKTNQLERCPQIQGQDLSISCENCTALSINDGNIVLDYNELSNPIDEHVDYTYSITDSYSEAGYEKQKSVVNRFILRVCRNNTEPQLCVWIKDRKGSVRMPLQNGEVKELSDIHFIPGDSLPEFRKNDIFIENAATEGPTGASIQITEISIKPEITQKDANGMAKDNEAFVDFTTPELPIKLLNGGSESINPKVGWLALNRYVDYVDTQKGRRYDVTVKITVFFKYKLDKRGNGVFSDEQEFNATLIYKVFQDVQREWLGIDFGTSAIVAQYSDEKGIRNLRKVKETLYENENFKEDTFEVGTKFLSSNVIFKKSDGGTKRYFPTPQGSEELVEAIEDDQINATNEIPQDSEELVDAPEEDQVTVTNKTIDNDGSPYHMAAICLSPTSSLEQNFNEGILPCLKLMVGYERLPILPALSGLEYFYKGDKITFGQSTDNPLAKVENVFREVYSQLLRFFVLPLLEGKSIDNIVLTVPNTYTSSHLDILKDCIKQSVIGDNVRNIRFVSESDAVACYYQNNWALLNANRSSLNDENILVYDMGAGTLDVSLLSRHKENNLTTITVKGKIGVGRAGNYLDALLAEILAQTQPESNLAKYVSPNTINDPTNFKIASAWKRIIKDVIKPKLNTGDASYSLSDEECENVKLDNGFKIDLSALRSSRAYEQYLESCSSDILNAFFEFQGYDKRNHRPNIDTIVLSGRASNQMALIAKLQTVLIDWCGIESVVVPLWAANRDASKTAVIEGAISLETRFSRKNSGVEFISNNITADYGIIYKDDSGKTCYMELLNHSDKPDSVIDFNGVRHSVYHKVHDNVDLHSVETITLVQTYTKTPVLSQSSGALSEYCTVMGNYIIPGDVDGNQLRISIDVDDAGRISIDIDGAGAIPQAATQVDLNNDVYQKGLWPMMSKKETNI